MVFKNAAMDSMYAYSSDVAFTPSVKTVQTRKGAAPYFFSFITCYAGHLSNEALENSNKSLTPHDPIADLLFFDWVGKLLFHQ